MLADVAFALDELLPAQRQAVTYVGERLVLTGTAGTGKTAVIEARFAWLVGQGHAPERLVVVAPTPARAAALRGRLEGTVAHGYDELFVLTPAELAARLLEESDALDTTLTPGDRL